MDTPGTRIQGTTVATLAAAVVTLCAAPVMASGDRSVTSHVVIGVTPGTPLAVSANGDELPDAPFVSSETGVLSFEIDDSGLPPGPVNVVIGAPDELVLSGAHVESVTTTSAVVAWTTNLPSTSVVDYGLTESYGYETSDPSLVTSHSVELTGLSPGTSYHFRVSSDDGQGHSAGSGDEVFETELGPLEISDVTVDSLGLSWASVSWQTNRAASSSVEYGETESYGVSTPTDSTLVTSHSITLSGLSPGTAYHFRARSEDGLVAPAVSGDHLFVTDEPPPLAIGGVEVVATGEREATVVWTTNRPASSLVEYGTSEDYGSGTLPDPTLVVDHEMTLSGLEPGTHYHFRVWSAETGGEPVCSDDDELDTEFSPLSLDGVTVDQVGQTWAVLSWTTDRPALGWVDYGPTDAYGSTETPASGYAAEHSATLSGLAEGALYHFRVHSEDEHGMTASSSDSTFETMEVELTGPPQMEGVGYDVLSATSILITWTTDRPASSQVRYGTGDVFDCETAVDTTAVLEHSVVVWPVAPRIEYTFVAVSACGCDTTTCEPMLFSALPPQGQNSQVVPIEIIKVDIEPQDSSAIVLWATDRPCSSWVELGKSTQYETAVPGTPLGEAVYTATVESLAPGTTYHLRVSTWDVAFGESEGDDLIFSTEFPNDGQPPAPPTGVACHQAEGGVEVTWDPNTEPDLLGYNLYRARYRDDGIDWSRAVMLTSTPTPDVRYFDRSVEEGASYEYAASAVDRSGNESGYSTSAAVTVESAAAGLAFGAYPNPMRREAHLIFALPPGIGEGRVRIVSLSGRIVMETDVSASSARSAEQVVTWNGRDRGGWPVADGVYMCELVAGGQVARRKLTVLR